MSNILSKVNSPEDIKNLSYDELDCLSTEIRQFFIEHLSKTGGHLASNLGTVELTLAINRVYNPNKDRILYDVGHQCYTQKILTGRKNQFDTLRCFNGLAGFPRPYENDADAFTAGHSSDAVSVAYGMAKARSLRHDDYDVCVVLGDGSLTGGLAYEGLESIGHSKEPVVVILNDNGMSISKNVGGTSKMLQKLRVSHDYINFKKNYRNFIGIDTKAYKVSHNVKEAVKSKVLQGNIFSELGFYYLGPIDGHNIKDMEDALIWAREMRKPVLLHVVTQKGKGCTYAQMQPHVYHGVGPFDPVSGDIKNQKEGYGDMMGRYLTEMAESDDNIVAITAAMSDGTGLNLFRSRYPDRFLDVGITEGNAVSVAAGLAKQGMIPVFAVYSTFLQRAYDMLIHDVSLLNLHVVFCVDRAGIVGKDGETHQGTFDVAYLSSIPNMTILCPASYAELKQMLYHAIYEIDGPVAIRYPRGGEGEYNICRCDNSLIKTGKDVTIITYGGLINHALDAEAQLVKEGIGCDVIKLSQIRPLDYSVIEESLQKTGKLIVLEDVSESDCIGMQIVSHLALNGLAYKTILLNSGNGIVTHGDPKDLYRFLKLDCNGVKEAVYELLK